VSSGSARRTEHRRAREAADVALGLVYVGGRAGVAAGRLALMPLRVAVRVPIVASVVGQMRTTLAAEGEAARVQAVGRLETATG
jgi:hypothetical protein